MSPELFAFWVFNRVGGACSHLLGFWLRVLGYQRERVITWVGCTTSKLASNEMVGQAQRESRGYVKHGTTTEDCGDLNVTGRDPHER